MMIGPIQLLMGFLPRFFNPSPAFDTSLQSLCVTTCKAGSHWLSHFGTSSMQMELCWAHCTNSGFVAVHLLTEHPLELLLCWRLHCKRYFILQNEALCKENHQRVKEKDFFKVGVDLGANMRNYLTGNASHSTQIKRACLWLAVLVPSAGVQRILHSFCCLSDSLKLLKLSVCAILSKSNSKCFLTSFRCDSCLNFRSDIVWFSILSSPRFLQWRHQARWQFCHRCNFAETRNHWK